MGMKVFPIADAFRLFCNDKVQWRARCPVVRAGSFHTATLLTATTTNARGLTVLVTDVIIIGSVSYYGAPSLAPSLVDTTDKLTVASELTPLNNNFSYVAAKNRICQKYNQTD